jgi:diguanylate cyclase (GGDEF)-like protein
MHLRDRLPPTFEPELETRFLAHYAAMLANARTLDGSVAVALLAFGGWVAWIAPWALGQAVLTLAAAAAIVLGATIWLHARPVTPVRYRTSTGTAAAAIVGAIIVIHVLIGCEVGLLVAAVSGTANGYSILQLRLREGLVLNGTASVAVLGTLLVEGRGQDAIVSAIAFLLLGLFVNIVAGSYMESTVRRLFMLEVVSSEAAMRDALTGVLNRRAISSGATAAQRRLLRDPVSVILADLDHFKTVNDRFGHEAGDAALQACVAAWRDVLRGDDLLARIGGEEFLIILPGTPATGAGALADRLRAATASIELPRLDLDLSASFGVAAWAADEALEDSFRRADAALYRAKEAGRNRVELTA